MFDTMTMTKILGGLCGALLLFLLGNWAAESLYHVGGEEGGEETAMAYEIEVEEESEAEEEVMEIAFSDVLALADIEKGAKVFGKCKACHKLAAGANGTGPTLFAVLDRDIGSVDGYGYSGVLSELPGDWTAEALNEFLENPKKYAAGTKMAFSGLSKIDDRANLIAYLSTIGE